MTTKTKVKIPKSYLEYLLLSDREKEKIWKFLDSKGCKSIDCEKCQYKTNEGCNKS